MRGTTCQMLWLFALDTKSKTDLVNVKILTVLFTNRIVNVHGFYENANFKDGTVMTVKWK